MQRPYVALWDEGHVCGGWMFGLTYDESLGAVGGGVCESRQSGQRASRPVSHSVLQPCWQVRPMPGVACGHSGMGPVGWRGQLLHLRVVQVLRPCWHEGPIVQLAWLVGSGRGGSVGV